MPQYQELNGLEVDGATVDAKLIDQATCFLLLGWWVSNSGCHDVVYAVADSGVEGFALSP